MTLAAAASSKMATADLIRFIKLEADQAEEKAKRLREQANMLAQQYGESLEEFGGTCVCVFLRTLALRLSFYSC